MISGTLYKIGGSLLDWPEFPGRLRALLEQDSQAILLAGGGRAADVVREWDRVFQLGNEAAHDLAMRSLSLTTHLLPLLLPGKLRVAGSPQEWTECLVAGKTPVVAVHEWVQQLEENSRIPLVPHWETTSDTLALWLSLQWKLPRLVLVKSVPAPAENLALSDWERAAAAGQVDQHFPDLLRQSLLAGASLEVQWLNLREVH